MLSKEHFRDAFQNCIIYIFPDWGKIKTAVKYEDLQKKYFEILELFRKYNNSRTHREEKIIRRDNSNVIGPLNHSPGHRRYVGRIKMFSM